ncbi:Protein of unknown function [Bacillus mycoides]|nr:Protein of unknown function [Bacillus mycoides]
MKCAYSLKLFKDMCIQLK